jgi:DnaK suppressor protein
MVHETAAHTTKQLALVRQALAKFDDHSYGLCENCGEEIGFSRLNARPEARLCIICQTRMEQRRR